MKLIDYLNFHNKIVRHNGHVYRIIAQTLGKAVLVNAECVYASDGTKGYLIDLVKSRTPLSADIRHCIGMNLVSWLCWAAFPS